MVHIHIEVVHILIEVVHIHIEVVPIDINNSIIAFLECEYSRNKVKSNGYQVRKNNVTKLVRFVADERKKTTSDYILQLQKCKNAVF